MPEFVNTDELKKSLAQIVRRRIILERFIRPLGNELAVVQSLQISVQNVFNTLGITAQQLEEQLKYEPVKEDVKEVIDILMENLSTMPGGEVSVADAAYLTLAAIGHPVHYKEIAEKMKERGFNIPGNDPKSNLLAHMINDKKRFVKTPGVGRGFWGLVAWAKAKEQPS